jgi:hypothetical protein
MKIDHLRAYLCPGFPAELSIYCFCVSGFRFYFNLKYLWAFILYRMISLRHFHVCSLRILVTFTHHHLPLPYLNWFQQISFFSFYVIILHTLSLFIILYNIRCSFKFFWLLISILYLFLFLALLTSIFYG